MVQPATLSRSLTRSELPIASMLAELEERGATDAASCQLAATLKSMDVDGDGRLGLDELLTILKQRVQSESKIAQLKKMVVICVLVFTLVCGGLLALMSAAIEMGKDDKPDPQGALKTIGGEYVSTEGTSTTASIADLPTFAPDTLAAVDKVTLTTDDGVLLVYNVDHIAVYGDSSAVLSASNGHEITVNNGDVTIMSDEDDVVGVVSRRRLLNNQHAASIKVSSGNIRRTSAAPASLQFESAHTVSTVAGMQRAAPGRRGYCGMNNKAEHVQGGVGMIRDASVGDSFDGCLNRCMREPYCTTVYTATNGGWCVLSQEGPRMEECTPGWFVPHLEYFAYTKRSTPATPAQTPAPTQAPTPVPTPAPAKSFEIVGYHPEVQMSTLAFFGIDGSEARSIKDMRRAAPQQKGFCHKKMYTNKACCDQEYMSSENKKLVADTKAWDVCTALDSKHFNDNTCHSCCSAPMWRNPKTESDRQHFWYAPKVTPGKGVHYQYKLWECLAWCQETPECKSAFALPENEDWGKAYEYAAPEDRDWLVGDGDDIDISWCILSPTGPLKSECEAEGGVWNDLSVLQNGGAGGIDWGFESLNLNKPGFVGFSTISQSGYKTDAAKGQEAAKHAERFRAYFKSSTDWFQTSPYTLAPTSSPTQAPTPSPTPAPTQAPTAPTNAPTKSPTAPTKSPTPAPTRTPTRAPTSAPTRAGSVKCEDSPQLQGANDPDGTACRAAGCNYCDTPCVAELGYYPEYMCTGYYVPRTPAPTLSRDVNNKCQGIDPADGKSYAIGKDGKTCLAPPGKTATSFFHPDAGHCVCNCEVWDGQRSGVLCEMAKCEDNYGMQIYSEDCVAWSGCEWCDDSCVEALGTYPEYMCTGYYDVVAYRAAGNTVPQG
eukprot:CAMPEP_0197845128 /NCGR_PEP_ID=MMETSP1438-20131217/2070_1 /TAXON_ID=1461541 /ORGANISM="Pterosperma sp., Strain CCMP1384" /LENGTH=883 /DNA_ID=CAMNT_0043456251 /DNA_START=23 /DNA_END=2674 /DNA_ORIENTATION=+